MSDIKTPADVAAELAKALGEKIDELKKMELPQTPEKADGGQESAGSIPAMPKQAGGTTDAEMAKEELVTAIKKVTCPGCGKKTAKAHEGSSGRKVVTMCAGCKSRNVGNVKKMDLPSSPDAASGGEIAKKSEGSKDKESKWTGECHSCGHKFTISAKSKSFDCPKCGAEAADDSEHSFSDDAPAHDYTKGELSEETKAKDAKLMADSRTKRGNVDTKGVHIGDKWYPEGHSKYVEAKKAELLSKPSVSEKQHNAMEAAAHGNSTLGIPKKVGKEFVEADKHKKSEVDALDVAQALSKAVVEKIAGVREQLVKMEQLEAAGNAGLKKNIGSLPSNTPSTRQIADGDAANSKPMPKSVFDLMHKGEGKYLPWVKGSKKPKAGEDASDKKTQDASGGLDTAKAGPFRKELQGLKKDALPMPKMPQAPTLKPAGVPGAKAGDAPKAPKAPGAPGQTGNTMKMELPQSPDKADGGQMASGSVPSVAKQAGGKTDAEMGKGEMPEETNIAEESSIEETHMGKDEMMPSSGGADSAGAPSAGAGMAAATGGDQTAMKMELPQTPEKADGGQESKGSVPAMPKQAGGTTDAEMKKAALPAGHPSPVFAAGKSMTGQMKGAGHTALTNPNDMSRANTHQQAMAGDFQPKGPINSGLELARPPKAGAGKAATLPKFGKAELDSAKCPKCGSGMTLCKCSYGMK